MLVDEITLEVEGGAGGRGAVAFQKVRLLQGPTGGNGGRGGRVFFEGVTDINGLAVYASRKSVKAEDGKDGRGQFVDGRDGYDLIVKVPAGTRITNLSTGYVQEIELPGQQILAAGGGMGGRGNFKFRSSTNTTPMEFEPGTPGDRISYRLELRLIADVGLVGLPNAGKSSLLNELTNAKSRVGAYEFTTLEPHLGSYYGLIIADIPGLIEGASEGKGLGVKFLKHIERTRVIFHLISAESDDPARDYGVIRAELASYNASLEEKEEHVFLTKSDTVSAEELAAKQKALKKISVAAEPISILDEESMRRVQTRLNQVREKMTV